MSAPNAGTYELRGKITLPEISQGQLSNSQVVVTINVNGGSTIYTGAAGAQGFFISPLVIASALSSINIILTSSAPVDQGLDLIKTTASLSELS
jgi:hypothetical protein